MTMFRFKEFLLSKLDGQFESSNGVNNIFCKPKPITVQRVDRVTWQRVTQLWREAFSVVSATRERSGGDRQVPLGRAIGMTQLYLKAACFAGQAISMTQKWGRTAFYTVVRPTL
jgi:hypothetical protein